jgi:hypothetical protein
MYFVYLSLNSKSAAIGRANFVSLSAFTFSTKVLAQVIEELARRNADEKFMLQFVTAREPQSFIIIPAGVLLEEGPAPAGVPYASPERRHPHATGHERPTHTKQKAKSQ